MKLSKNSWHYKFYALSFNCYSKSFDTINFCDYFWKLVLAFVLLPFTWISYLIERIDRFQIYKKEIRYSTMPLGVKFLISSAIYILIIFTYLMFSQIYKDGGTPAIIIFLVSIVLFAGLIKLIDYYWDSIIQNIEGLSVSKPINEIKNIAIIVKTGVSSFKNKNCPRVTWED
jgi:hypothetical protein